MMRRKVVLPQPDGPSSTMNSPSGTVSEMPLTAGTSPNFLMISLANTADIEPPRRFDMGAGVSPVPAARRLLGPIVQLRKNRTALARGPDDFDQALPSHFL